MPSLKDLFDLRDSLETARLAVDVAEAGEREAAENLKTAQSALNDALQQVADIQSKLDQINQNVARIPALKADILAKSRTLADMDQQLTDLTAQIASMESAIEVLRNTFPNTVPEGLLQELEELRRRQQVLERQKHDLQLTFEQERKLLSQYLSESSQLDEIQLALDEAMGKVNSLKKKKAQLKKDKQIASEQADKAREEADKLEKAYEAALENLITDLKTDVPIALLPVRLETRYVNSANGQSELKIRIYPDDIHQDTHEPDLTTDEEIWGKHFWRMTWRAGQASSIDPTAFATRKAQELAAWQQLASRYGPNRAAYIASLLTPTNQEMRPDLPTTNPDPKTPISVEPDFKSVQTKGNSSWTRAAQARALPDRWLVIGYRNGQVVKQQWGDLVPDILNTGPESKCRYSARGRQFNNIKIEHTC